MVGFMDNEFTFLVQVSKCISFAQLSESSRKHVYFESEKIFTNSLQTLILRLHYGTKRHGDAC